MPTPANGMQVPWGPDGKRLLGSGPARLTVWDAATGRETFSVASPGGLGIEGATWAADGKRLLAQNGTAHARHLFVWDAGSGRELVRCKVASARLSQECCSADGQRVARS